MKLLFISILMAFAITNANVKSDSLKVSDRIVSDVSPMVLDTGTYAQSVCRASTACPYGGYIYCSASGYGCSWYVQPGAYVTCTGYIGGYWQSVSYSCF